ncbi:MAG: hypothetical protein AYK22_05950 [Thermoplasmatales archaeon SG8-52-3]|nr:MAG: hypothetical protein AYK22_05950 [Thermoplasmatales archaeon SG8-52-3]
MKRIWPLIVVITLVLSGLGAVNAQEKEGNFQKFENISFSQPTINTDNNYAEINLEEGNSFLMEQGKPMLPMYTEKFTFPFGTKILSVSCTPKNIQSITLTKEIKPSPLEGTAGEILNNKINTVDYGTEPYPNNWFKYNVGCGLEGSERAIFVKLELFPIQYYPANKKIEWANEFDIVVNYEQVFEPPVIDQPYTFVILTPNDYISQISALVTHKNSIGVPTKLVTLNEIYAGTHFPVQGRDDQEKIKYFIKNAIESWATSYVMLVGGSSKFPVRETHIYISSHEDGEIFVSDLYYADIYDGEMNFCSWDSNENDIFGEYNWQGKYDTVDLYPDVSIGRLAATSTSQVTTVVNKIKTYEVNEAYTQGWFTNFVLIGGDTWVPDHGEESGILEGEYNNQKAIDEMTGFYTDKIWASNGRLGKLTYPFGKGEISGSINSGCGFVYWSGHGNTNLWGTHPFEGGHNVWIPTPIGYYLSGDVGGLSNGNELPIVVIGGCSCGKFNVDFNCFGWSWLQNSNGGGIASVASSGLLYEYLGSSCSQGLAGKISIYMFKAYKDWGALTFGEMWNKAITKYIDTTSMKDTDFKTMEEWTSFGDPTLAIGDPSQAPNKPSRPSGPSSGKVGEQLAYTTSAIDPDGDDIYYQFDWDDGTTSEWIGPRNSGEQVTGYKTWTKTGNYQVRVHAKDDHGVVGEWSDALAVRIPRSRSIETTSGGTFTAELGIRGSEESNILLDGNYKTRSRFIVIWGTATGREKQGRFFGIFNENRFIIKVPTPRLSIKILGRCTIENQEISGNWICRLPESRGWIEGEFNPS